jgi:hypothetical protein
MGHYYSLGILKTPDAGGERCSRCGMLSKGAGVEGRGEMGASRLKLLVRRTGGWNLCFIKLGC